MHAAEGKQPQEAGQSQTENHRSVAPTPQTGTGIMAFDYDAETQSAQKQGKEPGDSQQGDQPRTHA